MDEKMSVKGGQLIAAQCCTNCGQQTAEALGTKTKYLMCKTDLKLRAALH
jgi:hypothetical protein